MEVKVLVSTFPVLIEHHSLKNGLEPNKKVFLACSVVWLFYS